MLRWLFELWDAPRRKMDMDILWPQCVELAKDLDHAKAAFFYHIVRDSAWTRRYSDAELYEFMNDLK